MKHQGNAAQWIFGLGLLSMVAPAWSTGMEHDPLYGVGPGSPVDVNLLGDHHRISVSDRGQESGFHYHWQDGGLHRGPEEVGFKRLRLSYNGSDNLPPDAEDDYGVQMRYGSSFRHALPRLRNWEMASYYQLGARYRYHSDADVVGLSGHIGGEVNLGDRLALGGDLGLAWVRGSSKVWETTTNIGLEPEIYLRWVMNDAVDLHVGLQMASQNPFHDGTRLEIGLSF